VDAKDPVAAYDAHGHGYAEQRRADPRIAAAIEAALGGARSVVNVGAGAGSYEPAGAEVIAVEPSATMRDQRPTHLPPAIAGVAESLPLDDDAVDAAMAVLTVHHWSDPEAGLREMRRVAREAVAVLSFDFRAEARTWLVQDYLPELEAFDRDLVPAPEEIAEVLGGARIDTVPVPADSTDHFMLGLLTRPEAYLRPEVRAAQSGWRLLGAELESRAVATLAADLESGAWDERHGAWREVESYDGGLRLIVSTPGHPA
jgi:SAM-dependent methyltransferase